MSAWIEVLTALTAGPVFLCVGRFRKYVRRMLPSLSRAGSLTAGSLR